MNTRCINPHPRLLFKEKFRYVNTNEKCVNISLFYSSFPLSIYSEKNVIQPFDRFDAMNMSGMAWFFEGQNYSNNYSYEYHSDGKCL